MKKNYIKPSIETWEVEPSTLMNWSMGGEYNGDLGNAHAPALDDNSLFDGNDLFGDGL